jgi:hypothetical protein
VRCPLRLLPLTKRLGRRGAILGAFGTVWLLYGYSLLVEPIPSTAGLTLLLDVMPFDAWAWAWIACGGLAVVCAFMPPPADWPGFPALYLPGILWGLSYLVSWRPLGDNPRGWIQAAIWGAMLGAIRIAAGWPEPPRGDGSGHGNAER